MEQRELGFFYGIGVGTGPLGLIPIAAVEALKSAEIIFTPRAYNNTQSLAQMCLKDIAEIQDECFREIVYNMDSDRKNIAEHYENLAKDMASELEKGKTVAYLTIGDTLTYSTYSYALKALLKFLPSLKYRTIPGITSFAALAALTDFPLGQGKERTLILPCPDDMNLLKRDILTHDIVILMKIGQRLPKVLKVLQELNIVDHCVLGSRIGLPEEVLYKDLNDLININSIMKAEELYDFATNKLHDNSLGYLSTMLIRTDKLI